MEENGKIHFYKVVKSGMYDTPLHRCVDWAGVRKWGAAKALATGSGRLSFAGPEGLPQTSVKTRALRRRSGGKCKPRAKERGGGALR